MKTKFFFLVLPWLIAASLGIYILSTQSSALPTSTSAPSSTPSTSSALSTSSPSTFSVSRIIDGDTIQLETGQTVRYIGIDTPETAHPNKPAECFGKEAADKNKELVLGKSIQLEKDVSETDKYGRLLRYVWVGETLINDYLVRNGFAKSSSYPPDIKYQTQLMEAEREARDNQRGLWSSNACGEP